MSLVPAGSVSLEMVGAAEADTEEQLDSSDHVQVVDVGGCYIDQVAVTCADFAVFVRAGGYEDMTLWPKEIWPNVVQFVDKTGLSGPRWWRQRKPPRELLNHPVVGISWHEAAAYAAWAGKRLPTPAHWQRAGSWHASQTGQSRAPKYPWGDSFEDSRANVWSGGIGGTVAVRDYYNGCTPNGIYQLIGNCWEWVDSRFVFPGSEHSGFDMGEIRGGAFDTYFNSQATCHFRTGQPKHFRAKNIGFRCCVPITDLKHVPGKSF